MSLDFENGDVLGGGSDQAFILLNGTSFATGLTWKRIANPTSPKAEVREAAQSFGGADLHVLLRSGEIAGFGFSSRGHRKDGPVLLGVIDGIAGGGNWFGVFALGEDEDYYVAAVQGGHVIEDGIFPRAQVVSHGTRIFHRSSDQWGQVYAPAEFGFAGAEDIDLLTLVGKVRKPRLKPVVGGGKKIALILGALVLVAAGFGWKAYQDHLAVLAEEELRAQLEASLPRQQQVDVPVAPWVTNAAVRGGDLVRACSGTVSGRLLAVAGWDLEGIVCTKSGATQTLSRAALGNGGAPVTWIRDSIEVAGINASVSPAGGDMAAIALPLSREVAAIAADVSRVRLSDAQRYLFTSFEHLFIPIDFGSVQSINPFYAEQSFTFQTRFDPATFSDIFDLVPTLAVDQVEYSPKTGSYTVAGRFYEALEVDPNAIR